MNYFQGLLRGGGRFGRGGGEPTAGGGGGKGEGGRRSRGHEQTGI